MAWSFDVTSNIPRITQSGTDTNLAGIATAIAAVPTVARSTAYTTAQMVKPPTPTGFWYRCSTAGTTAATAPTYGTTLGGTTTDGTAVFTAFKAPDIQTLGTTNLYYMPDVRVQITGALTNTNPQQQTFLALDVIQFGASSNFISGAWASDGVTPLWDGVHFATTRTTTSGADPSAFFMQSGAQCTLIGGEVQVSGGVSFDNGTTPRSYLTRWRNTKEWGASSSRFRSYTTNVIFQNVEIYDMAFDLFRMPTVAPSIKARGAEYVYQYVGAGAGGADAKFAASNLENPNGTYDFDNYFGGWVELYNCSKGVDLNVVSQYPNSAIWVKHCVPLYQDVTITAKDTTGAAVQDVRFTTTESPTNAPTVTFTTAGGLKTWDFRTPLSYQTTTNASGIATTTPVLNVWYWQTSFKESLRFPSSTATYEGRAYNYKTLNVSGLLGASTAVPVSAGMIGLDTATTITETAALALTGITLTPSGATGGVINVTSNYTWQDIWNYYRAWISQFSNRSSQDTWTCLGGLLYSKAWTLNVATGVTISGDSNISAYKTDGTATLNGTAKITSVYTTSTGTSTSLQLRTISNNGRVCLWNSSTSATELYQTNSSGSAQTYTLYFPPGSAGLQKKVARELYGYQRVEETITLAAGEMWWTATDIPDVGITVTNQATVAAYTSITDYDKLYDYYAYKRQEEAFIKLGQVAVRDGTAINFGTYSGRLKATNASVLSITGSTIYVKGTALNAGTKFATIIATPPATWTGDTTESINGNIEDGGGDSSVNISASGVSTFEIWKITDATDPDDYATGTLLTTAGVGKYRFLHADGYKMVIRDTTTNFRVVSEMEKGVYEAALFFGAAVQLAQAPEVTLINNKVDALQVDVSNVMNNFDINTDSLHAISDAVDLIPQNVWAKPIEAGYTAEQIIRIIAAESAGILRDAGTEVETFTGIDGVTDRIIADVDKFGNRTAITLNAD